MEAKDGTTITMKGDEVARLANQIREHNRQ